MIHPNSVVLTRWLRKDGFSRLAEQASFVVDSAEFEKVLAELRTQGHHHTEEELRDRAVFRILTKYSAAPDLAKPNVPQADELLKRQHDLLTFSLQRSGEISKLESEIREHHESEERAGQKTLLLIEDSTGQIQADVACRADEHSREIAALERKFDAVLTAFSIELKWRDRRDKWLSWVLCVFLTLFLILLISATAHAQVQTPVLPALVVNGCGSTTLTVGGHSYLTIDSNTGNLCAGVTAIVTVNTSGLATSANQTNGTQETQVTDGSGHFLPTGDSSARTIHETIDNTSLAVTGTFWQPTQPVSCANGAACPVNATIQGTPTISGTVSATQGTSPWVDNVTTWAGSSLGAIANYGTSPGAVLVPGVNAYVTNTPAVTCSACSTAAHQTDASQKTQIVDGSGNVIGSANNALYDQPYDGTNKMPMADAMARAMFNKVVPWGDGTLASGAVTSAMTGTTSTSVIAGTTSNYIYVTNCTVSNASTTVSTDIILQDGSGGTTLFTIPAPAAAVATTGGGGATVSFPTPLKVPTSGDGLYAANVTTGSSTKISCTGYKSTTSY